MEFLDAIELDNNLANRFYKELIEVLTESLEDFAKELERIMLERFDNEQSSLNEDNWAKTKKSKKFGTPILVDTGKLRSSIKLKIVGKKIKVFAEGVKPHERSHFSSGSELALYLNKERPFMEIPDNYREVRRKIRDKVFLKLQDKYIKIMQQKGII